ncbi:MAG: FMN-binding protein [Solirubrobacteraceae bacterium]
MKSGTLTKVGLAAAAAAAITPAALPAAATAARTKTYKGALERTDYSNVRVTIKVTGKKIKSLSVSANPEDQQSYQRESYALPLLRREALKAQSYKVHTISGVTTTSEAFVASLYSAMRHAHLV